jgi:hypothetical protein
MKKEKREKRIGKIFLIVFLLLAVLIGITLSSIGLAPNLVSIYFAFVIIYAFYVFDILFNVCFKSYHYVLIVIIALTGPALLVPFYQIFIYSDKILHYIHPILLSSIVFFVVSKLKIKRLEALFITAFIVLASFAIFEIIEYVADFFFNLGMQGVYLRDVRGVLIQQEAILDPLNDTMTDLILGLLGVLTYLVYGILRDKFL